MEAILEKDLFEIHPRICSIPVGKNQCEDLRQKCSDCKFSDKCDYAWIFNLWAAENKKFGKDSLLGPANPMTLKPDFRSNHVLTLTGKYDFCVFNIPKTKNIIVINDIYVDEKARGYGLSKKILNYLMERYDRDIFAKCVRGTSAESFWAHIGEQQDANCDKLIQHDKYEHRKGKRDLAHYKVENKNKKTIKQSLF